MNVRYEGKVERFHVFRVVFNDKAAQVIADRKTIVDWLFAKARGANFTGTCMQVNQLRPAVPFPNPALADWFVLLEDMADIVKFEDRFKVVGFTPSMVV